MNRSPLSFAQARIWLLNQLSGPDSLYNVPLVARFRAQIDVTALRKSLYDVLLRHDVLRALYRVVEGEPAQLVQPLSALEDPLSIECVPARSRTARISELSAYKFALDTEIPFRAWLLSSDSEHDVLVVVIHHIAVDGLSLPPLLRDLGTAYASRLSGAEPNWAPLSLRYSDYSSWQRDFLGDSNEPTSLSGRQLAYWRRNLARLPAEITLPTDRGRPPVANYEGGGFWISIPLEISRRVVDLSRSESLMPITFFRAAMAVFLGHLGAGTDIPLAGFVNGRADAVLDDLVGFFVNTLVFRVDASGDPTFRELLHRVRTVELEAYSHQDVPFDLVVRELKPPRSPARHPLAQIDIAYEDAGTFRVSGLDADVEAGGNPRAKFDLSLTVVAENDSRGTPVAMRAGWRYATALFDACTIESMAARFIEFLGSAVADVDRKICNLPVGSLCDGHRHGETLP